MSKLTNVTYDVENTSIGEIPSDELVEACVTGAITKDHITQLRSLITRVETHYQTEETVTWDIDELETLLPNTQSHLQIWDDTLEQSGSVVLTEQATDTVLDLISLVQTLPEKSEEFQLLGSNETLFQELSNILGQTQNSEHVGVPVLVHQSVVPSPS